MESKDLEQQWKACELTVIFKPGFKCDNPLTNSLSAYMFMRSVWNPELFTLQSHFMAFFLDPIGRTIAYRPITTGNMTSTTIDTKLIACLALQSRCSSVITAISRPSGNINPSESDISTTRKLKEGLALLDIKLLDHFIIAGNNYLSMSDENHL